MWIFVSVQHGAKGGNGDHLPGDEFAACLQGSFDRRFNAATAGNLHANDLDAFDSDDEFRSGDLFDDFDDVDDFGDFNDDEM